MNNIFKQVVNNPLWSLLVWALLLSTKFIVSNVYWGTLVEMGGAILFIYSIYVWSVHKSDKSKK